MPSLLHKAAALDTLAHKSLLTPNPKLDAALKSSAAAGLPPITISGLTHLGVGNYTPTLQYVWSIEGVDTVTKVYRNHTFKAGFQIDDLEGDISQPPHPMNWQRLK